ncbi:PREDICTED: probable methyltransferase-like protein 15 homolog [Drosophila arizonae]|uniref:Probable methyltransferase-like protein 15 homolog n=1 Tax=Drosophila arizonae TaxID=7263 RepID=A0ABM1NL09_DROAR|nr:PREDICTED: probable methyltransferase-like protein 15 homolog [Drosophila arizonae]
MMANAIRAQQLMQRFLTRLRLTAIQNRPYTAAATASTPAEAAPHVPVLCETAIEYLQPKPGGKYIDMTFGAGGHTRKLLDSCPETTVYALDRDPVAHQLAQRMSQEQNYEGRVIPMLGKFSDLPQLLQALDVPPRSFDGVLFDFGCSSMQFDEAARGFSIAHDGPLDMRMDCGRGGVSAADVLARIEEADLARILRVYGEEKAAKKIARAIVEARNALQRIETTRQLADLVAAVLGEGHRRDKLQRPSHVATKTFQALRIFVNNELNEINYGMVLAQELLLRAQGRLVAITFHSLEDTIVKRHLNGNVIEGVANPLPLKYSGHDLTHDPELMESFVRSNWRQLHRHVILPDASEIARNSRSRSAKLRAAVKIK